MKLLCAVLLLSSAFVLAQDSAPANNANNSNGQVTVRGCVSRASGRSCFMKDRRTHIAVQVRLSLHAG